MVTTISTTIAKEIFLGTGNYQATLSVTSAGRINAPAPATSFQTAAAIYANLIGGSISNHGVISGAIPATDSYTAPAIFSTNPLNVTNYGTITGQSGIYLQDGGTITNKGSILGMDARSSGGYGVRLVNAELNNTIVVYGKRYGVAEWNASEVINAGSITGETAGIRLVSAYETIGGTLLNSGAIHGGASGVTETSALITNSGTIAGQSYGIRSSWGGALTNSSSGQISGGVDGVLLLNEQYQAQYATSLLNFGTLQGGYFGAAINFAYATNALSGVIIGTQFGAGIGGSGYLLNAGSIYAAAGALVVESGGRAANSGSVRGPKIGVEVFSDGVMTNASGGVVYGQTTAALNMGGYILNAGSMTANTYGLELQSGGIVVNSGSISSRQTGVYLSSLNSSIATDFLGNTGTIYGAAFGAILENGTVENDGSIRSAQIGVSVAASTSFSNAGDVYGLRYGVQIAGGTLVNSGSIGSRSDGIRLSRGNVSDSGTVSGTQYAIYGTSFSLTIDPGAVFNGNVADKSKTSTLRLGGDTPGTLTGLGAQFNGFSMIDFAAGAHWLISGTTAALAAGQVIEGFEQGDTIVVAGFSAQSENFLTSLLLGLTGTVVDLVSGLVTEAVDIVGSFTAANFSISSNATGTTIKLQAGAPCFVAGTRILTPRGEVAVEALMVGEKVITLSGEDRPIIWIGQRTIELARHPRPTQVQPVCICAGALGEDVPRRDLWVSPDHALLIDEMLVPAQLLLNGLNIYLGGSISRVTYYHVELQAHSVLFAENAAAESYLETGNRNAFENAEGEVILHPDFSAMIRQAKSCAPLLFAGAQLEAIRQRIRQRHVPAVRRSSA